MKIPLIPLVFSCLLVAVPARAAALLVSQWDTTANATYAQGSSTATLSGSAALVNSHGVPQLTDSTGYVTLPQYGQLRYSGSLNITDGTNPLTEGSIQFWFSPNNTWSTSGTTNILYTDSTGDANRIQFVKANGSERITLAYKANGNYSSTFFPDTMDKDVGDWNYIAMSWTPTTINLVLNGGTATLPVSNAQSAVFNYIYFGSVFGNNAYIDIDNLRISNTALSMAELQAGYSATLQFVPEPAGLALVALGGLCVAFRRRYTKSSAVC